MLNSIDSIRCRIFPENDENRGTGETTCLCCQIWQLNQNIKLDTQGFQMRNKQKVLIARKAQEFGLFSSVSKIRSKWQFFIDNPTRDYALWLKLIIDTVCKNDYEKTGAFIDPYEVNDEKNLSFALFANKNLFKISQLNKLFLFNL